MHTIKNDRYRRARGGNTKILAINCTSCGHLLCHYQKDGIGTLKRLYLDRIVAHYELKDELRCTHCNTLIGTKMIYQKENRLAYRLIPGAIRKVTIK